MTAIEVAAYVRNNVPIFDKVTVLGPGVAYHYTHRADEIVRLGHFRGEPLTPDLDHTQSEVKSPPAMADPGVVFAYASKRNAVEEGFGAEVIEISYTAAVSATHSQESSLGAPPTILICSTDILRFRRV